MLKNFFQDGVAEEALQRVEKLQPSSTAQWGKMNVAQMLTHCALSFETAVGLKTFPRTLLGKLIGGIFKNSYLNEKPLRKNSPTDKNLIITDAREFEKEKQRLIALIKQFAKGGPELCTQAPHSFFGYLTPEEWSRNMYKHLDHHLQQFGV